MAKELELGEIETRRMSIEDLNPAVYNPRKIGDKSLKGLGESIERFGMLVPIIWNERTGNIVGGHQRFKCLLEQGEDEVDVVVVDLDHNEEVALNITLNNRLIRGDFTQEVVGMLATTEVKMGSSFNDVGLKELFEKMRNKKWNDGKPKEPKEPKPPEPPEPEAVITCPKCSSQWKMSNNEVIKDGSKQMGSPDSSS